MIKSEKLKLRDFFLKKRLSLASSEIKKNSQIIHDRIKNLPQTKNLKIIACYFAINNEPDLREVIGNFLKAKKNIVVPAFLENLKKYKFVKLISFKNQKTGPYKIPQPLNPFPVNPKSIDLAFIPALAFSEDGLRLGYGKGVYDRLLANTDALKIGVCFDFQVIDNFIAESHDLKVDFIITEKRIIKAHNI